jgi:hypothetical protein
MDSPPLKSQPTAGIEQQRELAGGAFPKAASHSAALPTTPFALSASAAARLVLKRQLMLVARDKLLLRARLVQARTGQACGLGLCWWHQHSRRPRLQQRGV